MPDNPKYPSPANELIEIGRDFYRRGWLTGTNGNFSVLLARKPMRIFVTASGIEKRDLDETNFLELDADAEIMQGFGTPSADTLMHLSIYRLVPRARAVLHSHSVWGTILSDRYFEQGFIEFEGYEILKGLAGIDSHVVREKIPVVDNSQDHIALSHVVDSVLRDNDGLHAIMLRRNGLFVWGATLDEARKHTEILEYLFEVKGRSLK